jgi:multiple sugar transport system substrate-binding protein
MSTGLPSPATPDAATAGRTVAGRPLTATGWDHPRCSGPMTAAGRRWEQLTGQPIEWSFRPLTSFNDDPLDRLAERYDLLVVDHPLVVAHAAHLAPLAVGEDARRRANRSIGRTGESYLWEGRLLATAVDVACQVSALNPEILASAGEGPPRSWDDVPALAARRPGLVETSLTDADSVCTLLTLAACDGEPVDITRPLPESPVRRLVTLARSVPEHCLDLRPPDILDRLAHGLFGYTPAIFGYAGYLRRNPALRYGAVPRGAAASAGTLGGAGLAVSAARATPHALAFAEWVDRDDVHREVLAPAGGQPGSAAWWADPPPGPAGEFARQAGPATADAVIRPRHPAWSRFQEVAGVRLNGLLREHARPGRVHAELEALRLDILAG